MASRPPLPRGEHLDTDAYREDFRRRFWDLRDDSVVKLERAQEFREPYDPSWTAFNAGDWPGALYLIEARRTEFEQDAVRMRRDRVDSYRVRVVQKPLTPYLWWELHVLRLMGAISDHIRVIDAAHIKKDEETGPLPEIVCVGPAMYEVLYDDGVLAGAARHDDPQLAMRWRRYISDLYGVSQNVGIYADREVRFPPPLAQAQVLDQMPDAP